MRSTMKRLFVPVLVVALVALVGTSAATAVAAGMRWPVIGCEDLHHTFVNHYSWRYAPGECTTGGTLGTTEGIAGAHWRGWGGSRATATGYLRDGLGFAYPASITAYDLYRTNNFLGTHHYAAWYSRLHVVA
jgi:hypothetical protein